MVVGGRVLRTLETRRRRCAHRILRHRYHPGLYAALPPLPFLCRGKKQKPLLGSRSNGFRRSRCRSLLGRAATDVHLYSGQLAAMAARTWLRSWQRTRQRNKKDRPRLLFWIPPLFLLWLNLHGGFALGPALLLAYGVGLLMETAAGNTPWPEARPIFLRVLLLLLVCLALVPLNPSGAHLYRYPLDTLRSSGMRSFIGEWRSPDFHQGLYRPLLLLWLLLLTALATFRSRPRGRVLVPLLLTSFAALDAARHIPIFVLLAIPVIAAALPVASEASAFSERPPILSHFRPVFSLAVLLLMAVFASAKWVSLARNQNAREAEQFPQAAVAFLRASDYPARIFFSYGGGG